MELPIAKTAQCKHSSINNALEPHPSSSKVFGVDGLEFVGWKIRDGDMAG